MSKVANASTRSGARVRGMAAEILDAGRFELESGEILPEVRVAYRTWGRLAEDGANAVLVEHALTGSADVEEWWPGILGPGRALDPRRDFIVATNALGSCYGTTGPTSPRSAGEETWGSGFPRVTVRDMVNLEARVADALNIRKWSLIIGGSLGGMRALEWAATLPDRVASILTLGSPAKHSAWAIGWNAIARAALLADAKYKDGRYPKNDPPRSGLAAARATSMLSYRSFAGLEERFGRKMEGDKFAVERWLDRHGAHFLERFDANSWLTLSHAMDTHDIARGRGSMESVLGGLKPAALLIGISTDTLYPPEEIQSIAKAWPGASYQALETNQGHDGFLIEEEAVNRLVAGFKERG